MLIKETIVEQGRQKNIILWPSDGQPVDMKALERRSLVRDMQIHRPVDANDAQAIRRVLYRELHREPLNNEHGDLDRLVGRYRWHEIGDRVAGWCAAFWRQGDGL